jgi:hypothetical protein
VRDRKRVEGSPTQEAEPVACRHRPSVLGGVTTAVLPGPGRSVRVTWPVGLDGAEPRLMDRAARLAGNSSWDCCIIEQ